MKYVSLDLETTSLKPAPEHVLMLSMVIEDTLVNPLPPVESLPHFTCFVDPGHIQGEPYALSMNSWILDILAGKSEASFPIIRGDHTQLELTRQARNFLREHWGDGRVVVAGKNVGTFDLQFLPPALRQSFHHRTIDVGNFFVDFKKDSKVPDSNECLKRADLDGKISHHALEDARDVIRILRTRY